MRALVLVLDSVGIGAAPDAADYGDAGSDTLGHILAQTPGLTLPTLCSPGLDAILDSPTGARLGRAGRSVRPTKELRASFGRMRERSAGKDTTTGHWEIAGVVREEPFATFERFPDDLLRDIERAAGVHFIGNCVRSGTVILEELGAERVIARPFGGGPGTFRRTPNRHDFSMRPPRTVLDALGEDGTRVRGVGKIADIFAGRGISESFPTSSNQEGMKRVEILWEAEEEGLTFANLVDFDMLFGHRRDVVGYARALRAFDDWLGEFLPRILPDDLVIITADHGNDPTFRGTDHTRDEVPLFVLPAGESRDLGTRETFADVAATLADFFELPEPWPIGESFFVPCTFPA